jgi:hypothetical protein
MLSGASPSLSDKRYWFCWFLVYWYLVDLLNSGMWLVRGSGKFSWWFCVPTGPFCVVCVGLLAYWYLPYCSNFCSFVVWYCILPWNSNMLDNPLFTDVVACGFWYAILIGFFVGLLVWFMVGCIVDWVYACWYEIRFGVLIICCLFVVLSSSI